MASGNGYDSVARLLLDKGAKMDAAGKVGGTPLPVTSGNGDECVARLLLDKGAKRDAPKSMGGDPPIGTTAKVMRV